MGGAVSSGRDNDELIDNLMGGNYIRTRQVERVFRAVDRAFYILPESRDLAYKDLAWRSGPLHISAPCIYSEVMEALELKPGLSFLNIGSGTGYLSTMVGLLIGAGGINHGVEVNPKVVEYAIHRTNAFMSNSPVIDDFDFSEPKYYCGNGLRLAPLVTPYDRVYVGAGCPAEYLNYFKRLIKIGGILVMPLDDTLVQIRRKTVDDWKCRSLLSVSFSSLHIPTKAESDNMEPLKMDELSPPRLQELSRSMIRRTLRVAMLSQNPELRDVPPKPSPANNHPTRICIPIEGESAVDGLNALHELDRSTGANEMNALLSLVLSMGHNRVAGSIRYDDSSEEEGGNNNLGDVVDMEADEEDYDLGNRPPLSVSSAGVLILDRSHARRRLVRRLINRSRNTTSDASSTNQQGSGTSSSSRRDDTSTSPQTDNTASTSTKNDDSPSTSQRTDDVPSAGSQIGETPPTTTKVDDTLPNEPQIDNTTNIGSEKDDSTPKGSKIDATTPNRSQKDDAPASGSQIVETSTTGSQIGDTPSVSPKTGDTPVASAHLGERSKTADSKAPAGIRILPAPWPASALHLPIPMDWEDDTDKGESSDEESERSNAAKGAKQDSGIGDENTPSSESPLEKSESKSDESREGAESDTLPDQHKHRLGRRRLQKRSRCHESDRSTSTDRESDEDSDEEGRGRPKRRTPHPSRVRHMRFTRLSNLMNHSIKKLPIPHSLKQYVNYGRCYLVLRTSAE